MIMLKFLQIISIIALVFASACSQKKRSIRLKEDEAIYYNPQLPLDSFACQIKDFYQLPAIGIGIIDKDGKIQTSVVGKNKAVKGVPLSKQSKFQIASCTKSFTALLVAIMVSEGKLTWDTRVEEVFNKIDIHSVNKEITVLELLSHTSGFAQFWTDEEVFKIDSIIPNLRGNFLEQRKSFVEWNLVQAPAFERGAYHYSNGGYVIIAAMLERILGIPYENLIHERIFEPLNLSSAEFGYAFLKDKNQLFRHMHRDESGKGIPLQPGERIPSKLFNPCGFISINIHDFAEYLRFCIEIQDGNNTLINRDVAGKIFKNHFTQANGVGTGLGWQIIEINGIKTFGHTGSDKTVRAAMAINPRAKTGVVFATNIGDFHSEQAMVNVIHELIK